MPVLQLSRDLPLRKPNPPTPIHVMFLLHGFGVGGLENAVAHLVNHCDPQRFRFSICALTHLGGARERVHRPDTRFFALNKQPGNDWSLVPRIARIIKSDPVDVMQTHDWGTYVEGLLAARLARVPLCIHVEQGTPRWDHWRQRLTYRLAQTITDRFVPVAERLRRDMIERLHISPQRITLISNAVETDRFARPAESRGMLRAGLGLTDEDFVVGSIGRLAPVKGLDTLIQAVATAHARGVPMRLLLIGHGPLYHSLQRRVDTLGLRRHVFFLGERSDIPLLLHTLDVYVSSSLSEGRSLSIMEAMASGLPIVATAVGGTPEILSDGRTGRLVPPSDPDALCEKLLALKADPPQRARLGAAARRCAVEQFDVKQMIESYQQLYLACRKRPSYTAGAPRSGAAD